MTNEVDLKFLVFHKVLFVNKNDKNRMEWYCVFVLFISVFIRQLQLKILLSICDEKHNLK